MDDKKNNLFDSKIPLILYDNKVSFINMNNQQENSFDPNSPLILKNEIDSTPNISFEILKIKGLIQKKYLTIEKNTVPNKKISTNNDFTFIKSLTKNINNKIKNKTSSIYNSIENQKNEIKLLYDNKHLLDKNKIQHEIISNQQILIDELKKNLKTLGNPNQHRLMKTFLVWELI